MIRTILKPDKNSVTLQLPDDMVGTMVEVIAFSIEDSKAKVKKTASKKSRVEAFKNILTDFTFNSGGYKFDRDEANNYE